jgi:hypothetical protein
LVKESSYVDKLSLSSEGLDHISSLSNIMTANLNDTEPVVTDRVDDHDVVLEGNLWWKCLFKQGHLEILSELHANGMPLNIIYGYRPRNPALATSTSIRKKGEEALV